MAPPEKLRKKRPTNGFTTDTWTNVEKPTKPHAAKALSPVTNGSRKRAAKDDEDEVNDEEAVRPKKQRKKKTPKPAEKKLESVKRSSRKGAAKDEKEEDGDEEAVEPKEKQRRMNFPDPYAAKSSEPINSDRRKRAAEDDEEEEAVEPKTTNPKPAAKELRLLPPKLPATPETRTPGATKKLPASEVPHEGPVYPTRRAIFSRTSRPYIHAQCGQRFPHYDDVRAHHRTACQTTKGDDTTNWDDHPSCKVGIININYGQVRGGFVVLDKASWDKIQAAVKAGLKDAGEGIDDDEEEQDEKYEDEG